MSTIGKTRYILKGIWQKYRSEENHIQFESFLDEVAKIYRHYK